jgi:hypothetical protein
MEAAAWQQGAELAFAMLRKIEATSLDETGYEPMFRECRPQQNIVAAYMSKLRDLRDTRCELAFAAVLTDYLASSMHAGEPALDVTSSRYVLRPIATSTQGVNT